ncbi:hypothetical protein [Gaiella occulta]|nr:hypothetical protein [Gaiella occulta]
MTSLDREIIAATLNLLPFVTWDRFVEVFGEAIRNSTRAAA